MPFNRIETRFLGIKLRTQVREGYNETFRGCQVRVTKEQIEVTTCPPGNPLQPIAEIRIYKKGEVDEAKIGGWIPHRLRRVRFKDISTKK